MELGGANGKSAEGARGDRRPDGEVTHELHAGRALRRASAIAGSSAATPPSVRSDVFTSGIVARRRVGCPKHEQGERPCPALESPARNRGVTRVAGTTLALRSTTSEAKTRCQG